MLLSILLMITHHILILQTLTQTRSSSSTDSYVHPQELLPLRRSTREVNKPAHLQDCISNLVPFTSLPRQHQVLLTQISQIKKHGTYKEAANDPNWVNAMQAEIKALISNNTWDVVTLPPGKKPIGCK